jgi:hypothetical protein
VTTPRALRLARHPIATGARLLGRLALGPGLPVGRVAHMRRLLRNGLDGATPVLVVGHPGVVRQALPHARLDVAGTSPDDAETSVVSEALGAGSLPRRWDAVVVTELDPAPDRIAAAVGACRPGGVIALFASRHRPPAEVPGSRVERVLTSGDVRLIAVRAAA